MIVAPLTYNIFLTAGPFRALKGEENAVVVGVVGCGGDVFSL